MKERGGGGGGGQDEGKRGLGWEKEREKKKKKAESYKQIKRERGDEGVTRNQIFLFQKRLKMT